MRLPTHVPQSTGARARAPELPRVQVDTRMPPAPAAGGRIIHVGAPRPAVRARTASVAVTGVALVIVVAALLRRRMRSPALR